MLLVEGTQKMNTKNINVQTILARYGFVIVLVGVFLFLSLATENFFSVSNIAGVFHSMVPFVIMALGLSMVIMLGMIDISVGSIALFAGSLGAIAMKDYGLGPIPTCILVLAIGALAGALNGFLVVFLRVNPLIATLGSMIALRGLALNWTEAVMLLLPSGVRGLGRITLGPVYLDTIIMLLFVLLVHLLHRRTAFGKAATAIGNDRDSAEKIGLPVKKTIMLCFILSGTMAAIAGAMSTLQTGAVSGFLGSGWEFTCIAIAVVGGVSLAGGRGYLLTGIVLGALLFEIIQNGLIHLQLDPYTFQLIKGIVIFAAMYADAIRGTSIASLRKRIAVD